MNIGKIILINFNKKFLKNIIYFLKFSLVGVLNTILNYFVFIIFLLYLNIEYWISGIIGFFSGAILGFFLNRSFTFSSNINKKNGLIKYLLIQIFCLSVHICIQIFSVEFFSVNKAFSQIVSIIITVFINFYLVKNLIFNK